MYVICTQSIAIHYYYFLRALLSIIEIIISQSLSLISSSPRLQLMIMRIPSTITICSTVLSI